MRLCIYGAGAIGGYLGARLALAGFDVALIARGTHLEALRRDGLVLKSARGEERCRPTVTDDPASLPPQDYVIVTLKAHAVAAEATRIGALCADHGCVVMAVNGVPWWYFHGLPGEHAGRPVTAVDPDGAQWRAIRPERVLGAVVYPSCEVEAPGVIRHLEGDRFSLGEPDGSRSTRVERLAAALRDAGLKAPVRTTLRDEIWVKLWGNLSFNPISALTHATLEDICRFPLTRELAANMMREAQAVGEKLGVEFKIGLDKRIAGAEAVGAHKTSMLQDVENGRALELEALVGSVVELGRITDTPTPTIDAIYAAASLLGKTLGDARGRLQVQPLA